MLVFDVKCYNILKKQDSEIFMVLPKKYFDEIARVGVTSSCGLYLLSSNGMLTQFFKNDVQERRADSINNFLPCRKSS